MLTKESSAALLEFGAKTHAMIPTVTMTAENLERLDMMLLKWQANPNEQNESAILDRFAIDPGHTDEEPGDNY